MTELKIKKYIAKLQQCNNENEKFGLYLNKLNYYYNLYGGAAATVVCDIHKTQKDCEKYKPNCAFKLLKGFGLGDNIPPENRCVRSDYKDEVVYCQDIKNKDLCNNTMSTKDDKGGNSECVWKDESKIGDKKIHQCGFRQKDRTLGMQTGKPFTDKFIFE